MPLTCYSLFKLFFAIVDGDVVAAAADDEDDDDVEPWPPRNGKLFDNLSGKDKREEGEHEMKAK